MESLREVGCPADALVLNSSTDSNDRVSADPAIYSSAIVTNLKSGSLDRLDKMQVFVSVHLAKYNVAFLELFDVFNGFHGTKLTGLDFPFHRMTTRAERNDFTKF